MGDILKPTISLFMICLVVSALLGLTNAVTKDKITERARLDSEAARMEVLPAAVSFEAYGEDELEALKKSPGGDGSSMDPVKEAYIAKGSDGGRAGFVILAEVKGYGGKVRVIVGIDTEGKVSDYKIIETKETPGLGSKASEPAFRKQFTGFVPAGPLKVIKGTKKNNEDIDAISGATITSKAITAAVQAALDAATALVKSVSSVSSFSVPSLVDYNGGGEL